MMWHYGPSYSWEMIGDQQVYWQKHGMVMGDYYFEKNRLVELYKEGKITLREMLFRWKRDAKPHKKSFDEVLIPLLKRSLRVSYPHQTEDFIPKL